MGKVAATLVTFTAASVKFPTFVTVEPSATAVLPKVTELLARYELGNVAATLLMLALVRVRLPTLVADDPNATDVLPNVTALLAR